MTETTMTMIVAGYVQSSIHTTRHEAQVGPHQMLEETAAVRQAKVTQLTFQPD